MNPTSDLINQFKNKAYCSHSQRKAHSLYRMLKDVLSEMELHELTSAWCHYEIGEGPGELFEVCSRLIEKYDKGE